MIFESILLISEKNFEFPARTLKIHSYMYFIMQKRYLKCLKNIYLTDLIALWEIQNQALMQCI